jgi:hypothetical protein
MEFSGPVQACNGIALPFIYTHLEYVIVQQQYVQESASMLCYTYI